MVWNYNMQKIIFFFFNHAHNFFLVEIILFYVSWEMDSL